MRLEFSLSVWNYEAYMRPGTLDEAIQDARSHGYGVEVWPSWKDEKDLFAPENRERLVGLLKGVPSSLHSGDVYSFEDHKMQIDAARDTGSSVIVVHSDHFHLDESNPDYGLAREVVSYARENGVVIALENGISGGKCDSQGQALDAVDGLRACIDIGHVYCANDHPLETYLERVGDRLSHLHLQDVFFEKGTKHALRDTHCAPGQCDIPASDWAVFIDALEKIDFSGLAVLEVQPLTPIETAQRAIMFLGSFGVIRG